MAHKLGIFGGTFDPIHNGHLFIAEEARSALSLDEVIFVPSGTPPHKSTRYASAEDRYNMTALAVKDNDLFTVSRYETELSGKCYTSETIKEFAKVFSQSELFFVTGDDTLIDIMSWHEPREIIQRARIITVGRPGYSRDALDDLPEDFLRAIIRVESPKLDISSTCIRARIAARKSIRYLVPQSVIEYIEEHELYRNI